MASSASSIRRPVPLKSYSEVMPFLTSSLVPGATLALARMKSQRASAGTQNTFFSV